MSWGGYRGGKPASEVGPPSRRRKHGWQAPRNGGYSAVAPKAKRAVDLGVCLSVVGITVLTGACLWLIHFCWGWL